MKINTTGFGELEYREEDILHFPKGIFGFPEEKLFYLITNSEYAPFMWLQSLTTPQLAFVVLDPWMVCSNYEFDLADDIKRDLKITAQDQVMILGIVVVPEVTSNMTINLRAPLIINVVERLGEQYILAEDDYDIRYPVLAE